MNEHEAQTIAHNITRIHETIAQACHQAGRSPQEITLVAVSKRHTAQAILHAHQLGIQHFGENRIEEAQTKIPAVLAHLQTTPTQPQWHMIGHIQSRKARAVIPLFNTIHSVDSVKLAQKLSSIAHDKGTRANILLEINISGELSKHGFPAHQWHTHGQIRTTLWQNIEQCLSLPHLHIKGLMTMAPFLDDAQQTRPYFAQLRQLRDALERDFGLTLPDLSMGMTNDYPVAIQEGATLLRIGTAIFGERST